MRDPRNGPEYDLPAGGGVQRSYVIASLPRSGSTLLARALWDTGVAGAPGEYFNPRHMDDFLTRWGRFRPSDIARHLLAGPSDWRRTGTWRSLPIEEYVRTLKRHRTGVNGVFGVKLHYGHLERAFLRSGVDVHEALERPRWVWIVRRDHIRQAVSYVRALQSDRWRGANGNGTAKANGNGAGDGVHAATKTAAPRYDYGRIARRRDDLIARERAWERWLGEQRVEPLRVIYESFVESYEPTVRRVLDHLEIDAAKEIAIPPPPLRRQADALTETWIEDFRRDAERRGDRLPGD